ncbi:MAG: hypothetical protein HY208_04055 [Nitrospirae bacterium]|nr:hypothetical protein [Nitrospirota bacterium]
MHRINLFGFILGAGLLIGGSWLAPSVSSAIELQALLDAPNQYDGQEVTVTGTASVLRQNESRGKPFTVFDLTDGAGRSVRVFSWGPLPFHEGDLLTIEGTFLKAKQVGQHTIKNEIEARFLRLLTERH